MLGMYLPTVVVSVSVTVEHVLLANQKCKFQAKHGYELKKRRG